MNKLTATITVQGRFSSSISISSSNSCNSTATLHHRRLSFVVCRISIRSSSSIDIGTEMAQRVQNRAFLGLSKIP